MSQDYTAKRLKPAEVARTLQAKYWHGPRHRSNGAPVLDAPFGLSVGIAAAIGVIEQGFGRRRAAKRGDGELRAIFQHIDCP